MNCEKSVVFSEIKKCFLDNGKFFYSSFEERDAAMVVAEQLSVKGVYTYGYANEFGIIGLLL